MKIVCVFLICCLLDAANCGQCEGHSCTICPVGSYKGKDGSCKKCERENCHKCSSRYNCDVCNSEYYVDSYGDDLVYCKECGEHCSSCISNTQCVTCLPGYYTAYDARDESVKCFGCSKQCPVCPTGQYTTIDSSGQTDCSSCITTCSSCISNTQCTSCQTGYYIQTHESDKQYCASCSKGCTNCTSHIRCTLCQDGYYIASDIHCNPCPAQCTRCSSDKECSACANEYYGVTCDNSCQDHCVEGKCTISGCTISCKIGMYKDTDNVCKACPLNCKSCSSNTDCNRCDVGYYSVNNQQCQQCTFPCKACVSKTNQCTQCQNGYYLNGAICTQCPNGCAVCSSGPTCSSCNDGYYKSEQTCDRCPTECTSCTTSSHCTVCSHGYYLATFQCHQCPQTCVTCVSAEHCNICQSGYQLNIDRCVKTCSANCNENQCKSDGTCKQCKLGYFLQSGNCLSCSDNCKDGAECNPENGTCTDGCKPTWTGDQCAERCPINCTSCKQMQSDMCMTCKNGNYGTACENRCSEQCKKSNRVHPICFKDNGTCSLGCVQGFWGSKCDNVCSDGCAVKLQCSTDDGRCNNCKVQMYGDHCKLKCSNNCNNPHNGSNICDRGTGACLYGCSGGIGGDTCGEDGSAAKGKGAGSDNSNNTVTIAAGAGGAVLVAVVVVVIVCVVRRRRRKRNSSNVEETPVAMAANAGVTDPAIAHSKPVPAKREESVLMETSGPSSSRKSTTSRLSELPNQGVGADPDEMEIEIGEDEQELVPVPEQTTDTYYNMAGLIRSRIDVDKLQEYVLKKTNKDFMKEFMKCPTGLKRPYNDAMQNKANNRYAQIYPYDASRVKLNSGPSDYINASTIDCYKQYNTYIASLGPTDKTMPGYESFWTMVWQENVEVIVMLTNLTEGGMMKCEQYWPGPGTSKTYGDVTVTCHSEDVYAEYTVRSFTVQSKPTETRTLHHIHFTAWPDKGVPDDVTSLIEFRQRVITCPTKLAGPTIVHCSAGIGRTGTYIALDILTREGRAEKYVDVFGCVMAMRGHRVNMVQTAEQYEYLHNALVHALTFDCDPIQSSKVPELLASVHESTMHAQFEYLNRTTNVISEHEKKAVTEDKALTGKNRQGADIPGRRHRPWLSMLREPGSSNYINAVYVNSFKQKDRYVVAQTPLPTTVVDFLTLVMQTDCPCIVSLDDDTQRDKTIGVYLPAVNKESTHGNFLVKCISCETKPCEAKPQYTLRQLDITAKNRPEHLTVYHFQFTMWRKGDTVPNDPAAFQQLTRDVERMSLKAVDPGPIIVHCLMGAERSGLFCVVSVLIQKMEIEHQVSVVNTVRQVKARRRRAIPNKEQYKFYHQCLHAYMQSFDTYSNFSQ